MNNKLWGGIIITVLAIIALVIAHAYTPAVGPTRIEVKNEVIFYDQATGEAVPVTFTKNGVIFISTKLGTMMLPQTISADGARYANEDESIVLWNKGDSIFITQNGTIVFSGSIGVPPMISAKPAGKLPAGSNPPGDPQRLVGTWLWQRTVVRDAPVITPKKAGVFTMLLDARGHMGMSTDCNGYGGDYQVGSDGVISMNNFVGTLMFCEGSQEQVFTGQLLKANGYSFDSDGNLLINYDNDAGSMIFSRK